MFQNKLRIGLLLDDESACLWVYKMLEQIHLGDYAEIVLIVKKKASEQPQSVFNKRKNLPFLFNNLYKKFERSFLKASPDAFRIVSLEPILKQIDILEVKCIEKKFSDYIVDTDIEKIKQYNIDVFLRLGFRILRGNILKSAKMGVWSYHHGDNFNYRGGPAGFWEVFKRDREVGSVLQILSEDLDGGEVLYRSWSTIYRTLEQSLNSYYWKTALFVPRKLKELHTKGEEKFFEKLRLENGKLCFYSERLYTTPRNSEFLSLFISNYWDWLKLNIWKIFNFEQWVLLYSFNQNGLSTSLFRYKKLVPPKDRFWADPFVVFEEGKYFIFFEELIYKETKGHLSVIEIDKKGVTSQPKVILKKPYHLSYPFIFKYEDTYYMIPETEENANIQLYQSTNFPYEWKFKMNLMENVKAVDTTLFIEDGKFWMFTNIKVIDGGAYSEELFLFSSDSLFSNSWTSHPANPVVSDVKSARPAGRLFYKDGKLYRPSQDCSYKYGYATVINEVLVLNENEYKEVAVTKLLPNWSKEVSATHSFTYDNGLSVIDASVKRSKWF